MAAPHVGQDVLAPAVEQLLRVEDWDTVTVKLIMRKLEAMLAGGQELPAGWLQPHKKLVKQLVDEKMQAILQERQAEASEGQARGDAGAMAGGDAHPQEEEPAHAAAGAGDDELPAAGERPEPPEALVDAGTGDDVAGQEAVAAGGGEADVGWKAEPEGTDEDDENEVAHGATVAIGEDELDTGSGVDADPADQVPGPEDAGAVGKAADDDDEEVPAFIGRVVQEKDGKQYYNGFTKWGETYRVGTDVYLEPESLDALPFVARLLQVYAYGFAEDEVYFNARWYYRDTDVRVYGLQAGQRVQAAEGELYLALHEDENHADTVLRGAKVYILEENNASVPENLNDHEYFCRKAYHAEAMHAIADLDAIRIKALREVVRKELRRQPYVAAVARMSAKRPRVDGSAVGKGLEEDEELRRKSASFDELRAILLTRKTIMVWLDAADRDLHRVLQHSLVRASQRLQSGAVHFTLGVVLEVRSIQPYKVGSKVTNLCLVLKTTQGRKQVRIDALSNEVFSGKECSDFLAKVPINAYAARDKAEKLRSITQRNLELFTEDERRRMEEEAFEMEETLRRQREAERQRAADEERRALEREEVRQQQAQRKTGEQWWKTYAANHGSTLERENLKWTARLKRLELIAESTAEEGERQNAARLAEHARKKLAEITSQAQ